MATVIKINKQVEQVVIECGGDELEIGIPTDDASIDRMVSMVGNAMDRFASIQKTIDEATGSGDEDKAAEATDAMVRLERRVITAIVGEDGYEAILALMSDDGEQVDPAENIVNVGEVLAGLVTWLYEHCTSKQLREAGVYAQRQSKSMPKKRKRKAKR